jgi:RNA polymerase sigma factor (sigma-70 family)
MGQAQPNPLLRFLRRLTGAEAPLDSDAELLRRFAQEADRSAFELLLWRHGPMVLRTCRTILHDAHDAEDAFQATFLTLARKAATISRREALAAWLHRVARRVAVKLARRGQRRSDQEQQGLDLAALGEAPDSDPVAAGELRRLLHEEVERLPAKYRAPVVLCYLEGRTNEEAAAQLGWPRGTVSGRLARARDLLRRRLQQSGLPVSGGLALTLFTGEASAAVPDALISSTLQAAVASVSGEPLTSLVSARVLSLTEGASTVMSLLTSKMVFGLLLGLTTAGALVYSTAAPAGDVGKEVAPGAPAARARVVRVPSSQNGILIAVGTEVKKENETGKGRLPLLKVQVGKEVRLYQRLREGDKVKEGQMLAQLDDQLARTDLEITQAKLAAAEAGYQAARATAKEAEKRLDRMNQIKRQAPQAISTEEYEATVLTRDRYRAEESSKQEAVRAARLDMQRAQLILAMYTIRSPVSGVVQRIHRQRGEGVRSLETLFEIRVAEED